MSIRHPGIQLHAEAHASGSPNAHPVSSIAGFQFPLLAVDVIQASIEHLDVVIEGAALLTPARPDLKDELGRIWEDLEAEATGDHGG